MKKSDKIFGTVVLTYLIVPLLILLSLKKSVYERDFTTRDDSSYIITRGSYEPYKVVKIVAPVPGILKCQFIPSDSTDKSYTIAGNIYEHSRDSVRIYNRGDTLFLRYEPVGPGIQYLGDESTDRRYSHINVNLSLYSFDEIIVENSHVILDSLSRSGKFGLYKQSSLSLAQTGWRVAKSKLVSGNFESLTVSARNSTISVGGFAKIRNLNLDLHGVSHLNVDSAAQLGQVNGTISPDTKLNVSPNAQKKLQFLIAKDAINKEE